MTFLPAPRAGVTLIELLVVLVLLGILAALAAPRLHGYIEQLRLESVLDQLVSDLYFARMLAVRSGDRVVIRFHSDPGTGCITRYSLHPGTASAPPIRTTRPTQDAPGVCVRKNSAPTLSIDSRGMVKGGQTTVTARAGDREASFRVSIVGNIYRAY